MEIKKKKKNRAKYSVVMLNTAHSEHIEAWVNSAVDVRCGM